MIGAVTGGARDLRRREGDAHVLPARLAHRARLELGHNGRLQPAMARRTRFLVELALRDVDAQLGWRRRHSLQIGKNLLRFCVGAAGTGAEQSVYPVSRTLALERRSRHIAEPRVG